MNSKIVNFILELPIIGTLVYRYLEYQDNQSDKRAYNALLRAKTRTVQVVQKNLLGEAITRLKRGIKANFDVKDMASGRIRNVELQDFATGDRGEAVESLRKAYVYNGTDIKNDMDRARMANKRVEDYRQLQRNVLQRRLIREIRKETDPIKKAELTEQFKNKLKGE